MADSDLQNTVAFRIVRQILDHIYGDDQEMTDGDFITFFRFFASTGGKWEDVIDGDPGAVDLLMKAIKSFVKVKKTIR